MYYVMEIEQRLCMGGGGRLLGKNLTHNMGALLGKNWTLNMGAFLGKNITLNMGGGVF